MRRGHHINKRFTPSRQEITEIIDLLLQIFYPGYHGRQDLSDEDLLYHVGTLVSTLRDKLERQIERCLCFQDETVDAGRLDVPRCRQRGRDVARMFIARLPEVRRRLLLDVQAAYDGDPAAASMDEIILAYPGLLAVSGAPGRARAVPARRAAHAPDHERVGAHEDGRRHPSRRQHR